MIWLVFALLTGGAMLSVLLPLAVESKKSNGRSARTLKQIQDIQTQLRAGGLDPNSAKALQTELARRPLRARTRQVASPYARAAAALFATLFIPISAVALYLKIGRYSLEDQPLVARRSSVPGHADVAARITEIEAYLSTHPASGAAYEAIAPYYLRERRAQDAVHALKEALRLLGPSAARLAALGEAKVIAQGGSVTPDAERDLEAALALDSLNFTSRYYLGLAATQPDDLGKK